MDVLVNCGAGSVDAEAVDGQVEEIRQAFSDAGVDTDVRVVEPAELDEEIKKSVGNRPDAVVVAGGDGTISCAAGSLTECDVPLGVLPLGTFNHFAHDLGLATEMAEAAAMLAGGQAHAVDLAEVNGEVFINNSVLGLYPRVVDSRDDIRRRRGWGKLRALPVAAVRALRRFPTHSYVLRTPEGAQTVRTPFVFIGNNRYEFPGGGSSERPSMDGGTLCVYLVRVSSRWGLVKTMVHAALRGAERAKGMERLDVTELRVDSRSGHLDVALDGEVRRMRPPLHYRIRPGALLVLRPSPDDAD